MGSCLCEKGCSQFSTDLIQLQVRLLQGQGYFQGIKFVH